MQNTMPIASPLLSIRALDRRDRRLLWSAIVLSFTVHIGIYYVLPLLEQHPVSPPMRIEVSMSSTVPIAEANPTPNPAPNPITSTPPVLTVSKPTLTKPIPIKPIKPIIKPMPKPPVDTAPVLVDETPAIETDYVVPMPSEFELEEVEMEEVETEVEVELKEVEPEVTVKEEVQVENTVSNKTNTTNVTMAENTVAQTNDMQGKNTQSTNTSTSNEQSAGSQAATADEAWNGYGQALYDLVRKYKGYPPIAIRRHWEGQTKVHATFVLGKLVDVVVIGASKHEVLDDKALAMVRKAINQLPVRGRLMRKSFTVTVPVTFALGA